MNKNLGERLRFHRQRAKLSQKEVAQQLYLERQTVSSWECNRTRPDIDQLLKFCDIVGVELYTLLGLRP